MVMPIEFDELLWRISALLRRSKITKEKEIRLKTLTLNADEKTAYLKGERIPLTVREFNILYKLLSYPKKAFTRTQLMNEFWDGDSDSTARTVDIYITRLRSKLSECDDFKIVTVYGLGLALVKRVTDIVGGEIELKSRLGEGSVFTVKIFQKIESDAI